MNQKDNFEEMKKFSRNSLITLLTEVLIFVFGFVGLIILARILGPEGKGIYSLVLLIPGIMITFGSFGIESANVYFVGSKKYNIQDVVSNSLILAVFLGLVLILIFWGITNFDFFQNFISTNKISSLYLWLVVLVMPISLLLSFFRNIIRGKGEITNYNKTKLLESVLQLLAVIVFLVILGQGVFGAVSSYILALVGAAFFSVFLIKRLARLNVFINKNLLKDSASYGGRVYLANSISFLNYRLDMLLIAVFLAPAAVGLYSIAVGISEKLFMIPGALTTVLFPKICSLGASQASDFTPRVTRHTLFILLISSFLLILLANPLIRLFFGLDFLPSILPLVILLPGTLAFGVGGVLAADLAGRGKPQFAIYSSFACLAVGIPLNILLIPRMGISGAAVASSIAYCVDTLVVLVAFLKISKKSLVEVLIIKGRDFQDYLRLLSIFKNWFLVKTKNLIYEKKKTNNLFFG
jgi:O-antigen/teichoic acid export membrane protein